MPGQLHGGTGPDVIESGSQRDPRRAWNPQPVVLLALVVLVAVTTRPAGAGGPGRATPR
jgi:hypothetical protein